MLRWVLVLLCLALASVETFAAESVEEKIEPVVFTGTRRARSLTNSPVKTEHVGKEVIERNHHSDVSQVLDNIPGVTLQNLTGRLGQAPVIQGLSDDRVLVLIDGIPQLQISSSGYDLTQLSVNDIESVEVIKGAASSLYGSQAMGGVINIITKRPTERTAYSLDLKNLYTSDEQLDSVRTLPNVINAHVSGGVSDLFLYKLSFGHRRQGVIDLDPSTVAQDVGETLRHNLSGNLTKKFNKNMTVSLDAQLIDEELSKTVSAPVGGMGYVPILNESYTTTQTYTLGNNYSFYNGSNLKTTLFYSQVVDRLVLNDNPATSYVENEKSADLNTVMLETQYDVEFFPNQETTIGAQYRYQFLDQDNVVNNSSGSASNKEVDRKTLWSVESYAQHSLKYKNTEFTPGVRGQYDSHFGSQVTPSMNFMYSPKWFEDIQSNIRGSIGVGYRVPTLRERFFYMDHRALAGYIIEGSTDLQPEQSVSYQLGIELINRDKFSFHMNGFLNNVRDMVSVIEGTTSDGTMLFTYGNIENVQTRGVEFTASVQPFAKWTIEQDVTLSRSINQNENTEVPLRPRTIYKLRAHWQSNSKLMLSGIFRYQSDEYVNVSNTDISQSYSVLDLMLNYQYDPRLKLYAGVENMFDVTRNPAKDGEMLAFDNRPVMGRQFYIGINFANM